MPRAAPPLSGRVFVVMRARANGDRVALAELVDVYTRVEDARDLVARKHAGPTPFSYWIRPKVLK